MPTRRWGCSFQRGLKTRGPGSTAPWGHPLSLFRSSQAASSTPPPAQQSLLQPLAACLHAGAAQEAFGSGEPPEGSPAGWQDWEGQEEPGPARSEATKTVLQPQLCLTVGVSAWTLELPAWLIPGDTRAEEGFRRLWRRQIDAEKPLQQQ